MITLKKIKAYIEKSENPLIFCDDDSDGLASYLLIRKYFDKGKAILITHSILDESYLRKFQEYNPDLILVLDKHDISQDFIDKVNVPIIWIDHHPVVDRKGIKYFNPRFINFKDNRPTSYWCYELTKENLWIAMCGIIADHSLGHFKEFSKKYNDLINYNVKEPFDVVFHTKFGILTKLFTFILKGKASEVKKSINILTRINDPYEILNQTTPRGKFIYKRFERINKEYESILKDAMQNSIKTKNILLYTYYAKNTSLSGMLANELIHRFKDKLIIIAREKSGMMKVSLRTYYKSKIILPPLVKKALEGLRGTGGGHEHACGGDINKEDFRIFVDRLEHLIK